VIANTHMTAIATGQTRPIKTSFTDNAPTFRWR
jgi:hypothetical protein